MTTLFTLITYVIGYSILWEPWFEWVPLVLVYIIVAFIRWPRKGDKHGMESPKGRDTNPIQ